MRYRPTRVLNKVKAGSAATVAGVALAEIIVFFVRQAYPDLPGTVELAIAAFVPAALMWLIAWLTPLAPGEVAPVVDEAGRHGTGV